MNFKSKNTVSLSRLIDNVLSFMDTRGISCEFYDSLTTLDNDSIYETLNVMYEKGSDYDNEIIKLFKTIYASNFLNSLTTEFNIKDGGKGIIYWSCVPGNNYKKEEIVSIGRYFDMGKLDKLIVISVFDKNYLEIGMEEIELFSYFDFVFNPFDSLYSSIGRIVTSKEELEELTHFKLSTIFHNDAVSRYLGAKPGDIITFLTPTMATKSISKYSVNYRKVTHNENKIRIAKGSYLLGTL